MPGSVSSSSDAYGEFWRTLVSRYPAIGLRAATDESALAARVSASTARRWVMTPLRERMPAITDVPESQLRLLEAALRVRQGSVEVPVVHGLDRWQRIRSEVYGTYDDDYFENRTFRVEAPALWQAFLRAAAVAAVVRGEQMWARLRQAVPNALDTWMGVLERGGLNRNGKPVSRLDCWIQFESGSVTVVMGTRRRVVGAATVLAGSWPAMTVRLRLDQAEYHSGTVTVPVPAATQHLKSGERDYPLILWFSDDPSWYDLDSPDIVHSPYWDDDEALFRRGNTGGRN